MQASILLEDGTYLSGRAHGVPGERVVRNDSELREFGARSLEVSGGAPVHIDKYLEEIVTVSRKLALAPL
jgi:hypothetical protein